MSRDILQRLEDIRDACLRQVRSSKSLEYSSFLHDEDAVDAAFARVTIIGEAVSNLPDEFLALYPHIDWNRIRGMRNFLIHVYFAVDLTILWEVIQIHIPQLLDAVEKIISELQQSSDSQ